MKAVISKVELQNLISKLQGIVSAKSAIPILSSVLIEAFEGQLILSATDLTTSMRCFSEAKIIEEGAIALPARRFFQLVRELTAQQVKISSESTAIAEISSGSSMFKINGIPKDEFPTMPQSSGSPEIIIETSILRDMLDKTAFSVARDDVQNIPNGILLKIANKRATCISTDGKRLAKVDAEIEIDSSFQGSYVIPLKAVEEMIKILESNNKTALSLTHDKIFLEYGNITLATKLIGEPYPEVEKAIPEKFDYTLTLHKEELSSLLRQIALFTTEDKNSVRFIFEEKQMELCTANSDIGEGSTTMPVDYSGPRLEIAFNPFYFLDILRHVKDEVIKFSLLNSFSPGIITDSSSAVFVIMPMRLKKEATKSVDDVFNAALV